MEILSTLMPLSWTAVIGILKMQLPLSMTAAFGNFKIPIGQRHLPRCNHTWPKRTTLGISLG